MLFCQKSLSVQLKKVAIRVNELSSVLLVWSFLHPRSRQHVEHESTLLSVSKRGSVFRGRSRNSVILIVINQPEATNGIMPSFEVYFTVRALTTKSSVVNIPYDSIKHWMTCLDNWWLHSRLDRSNWGSIAKQSPQCYFCYLVKHLEEMTPFIFTVSHWSCHSRLFVCLRSLLCTLTSQGSSKNKKERGNRK